MALDPLRFAIEIADDASQKIKAIKEELNKLEPKIKVTFDESSINVTKLRTALENAIKSLGEIKVSGAGINISGDALGGAADKITEAKEAIKGGRFGELAKRISEATTELERLTKAFETFQLTIGKDKGLKDFMTGLGEVISNVKTQLGALDKVSNSETSLTKTAEKVETNRRKFNELIEAAGKLRTELVNVDSAALNLNMDNPSMRNSIKVINDFIAKLRELRENGGVDFTNNHAVNELIAQFTRLKSALTDVSSEQQRLNKSVSAEGARDDAAAAKETEKWANSQNQASIEANKLVQKMRELKAAKMTGKEMGVDTTELERNMAVMQRYLNRLFAIMNGVQKFGHTGDFLGEAPFKNAAFNADKAATNINRLAGDAQKAASATSQLTAEEQRLAQALNQTTEHARGQSQVLSDLKSMAMQYLGVWGGQQFLHNIIEIGGQLEMQRLSIGAILSNQSQANDLFEKIKGLAVQSPFGVVELDQMTKQLTAYGFKYNELFDMTKRLADISAATGTGVDRLALALGHVRSEAALSGYTLRQFSMANVPLLAKLSEKLGKTTQEIRKMVRAKEVSYEDVVGVLKDITNEGGMFYQMQEVISSSVKAKFKNVKDAMDIMYGEMAEGYIGDSLKGVAEALMEVTRNWKDAATVLATGAAMWATHRVAVMAYTATLGKNNAALMSSIAVFRQQEVTILRQASLYRTLSTAEKQAILTSQMRTKLARLEMALHIPLTSAQKARIALAQKQRVADLETAFASKKLNVEDLARQVSLGRVTAAEAKAIISKRMMAGATRDAAIATIEGTKVLGFWGRAALMASGAAIKLSRAVLSIFPQAALMAGITALVELWQRNSRELERSKEIADSIYERSQEALKNTRTMMQETDIKTYWRKDEKSDWEDVSSNFGGQVGGQRKVVLPKLDTSNAQESIEKWSQYIREYAATPNKILNDALFDSEQNVRSLEEQFDNLKKKVVEVADAQYLLQGLGDSFKDAIDKTNDGWLDDDLITNIEDYNKSLKEFGKNVSSVYKSYRFSVDKAIKVARQQSSEFDDAVKSMGSYSQQLEYLIKNQEKYADAVEVFKNAGGVNAFNELNESGNILQNKYYQTTFDEVKDQQKTVEADMKRFFVEMDDELERKGYKIGQMTVAQQQAVLLGFKTQFEGLKLSSQESLDYLMELVKDHYSIELDVKDELFRAKVDEATRLLNGLVNGEWKVEMNFATNINDVIDKARKNYKTAKEYFENAKPIMMKFGVNASFGKEIPMMKMTEILNGIKDKGARDFVEQVMNGWNEASKAIQQSIDASTKGGFSLEDPNKSKKNKNKNTGNKEDKNAKAVRERVRILKEAADAFEYWNKKLGQAGAWERVNEQFGDVLSKIGVTIDNIEDLRGHLKAVSNSKEYKAIKDQKVKLEIDKEIAKDLDQLNRKVFEKSIDEYKSKFTKTLDDLTRRWETFNAVRQATGSKAIALDIAGISEQDRGLRNAADAMRRKLVEEMRNAGGDSIVTAIPLDVYIDEEKLRDQFKSALGDNDEQAMKIDGLVEAYKRWQKAQQDVTKADIDAYAKIIGSVVDYTSRIDRINDKLEQEKENIEALVALYNKSGGREGISQDDADTAIAILMAKANFDKLKEGSDYINLMNRSLSMTKGEVTAAASAIEDSLNERLAAGVIKAEEYATEMKKLHDIVAKFDENSLFGSNSALTSFLSGGLKGSQSFVNDRIVSLTIKSNQEGLSEDEQNELDGLIELRKKLDSAISKLSGFAAALQVVTGALDGFHKAAQSLSEMFDALGKEGPASFWGDIADGISAVSSIFEPANNLVQNALSGNIGGVLSSAISAPVDMITGPITAFAKLHDKRLERAIERLREDVKSIEANTELIVRSRERTLGYDMGDVRRQMAQQYATPSYRGGGIAALIAAALGGSQQNKSMYDYYMQNSQGTGYQQEYDNLVEQRQKYMEILKDQQDKKKKSNDEIEETKSKIAELDDQIRYFTQDLAKELWGIDIKGWADQLSDALASAFENGENMAKAYRDTVTSILQQMMQKMMQMQILEPMFANLQKDLFGENGKGGVFDTNNPKGSLSKVTKIIGDYFGKGGEGEKAITASMEFMTAFQRGMQNAGLTVLNEASNTLSSGIQGTSEETSDLLAGYVNALRQDVSVNRILLTQYVTQLWPQYIEAYTAQVTSVSNIDNNVRVIMEMMQLGNGAMYEQIAAMRTRIDNIVMGIDRVSIR